MNRSDSASHRGHAGLLAVTLLLMTTAVSLVSLQRPTASAPAAASTLFVPASAHAAGANGASWRTDVEVHNPGATSASYTISLLRRDADNAQPETRSFLLEGQRSVRYVDVLTALFGFTGAAALRFDVTSGTLTVTSRTYNQIGTNPWNLPAGSSFGQFVPGLAIEKAIPYGEEGRLIQLTQRDASALDGFRTNIGLVNATGSALDVRLDLYRADGTLLGTRQGDETRLPPYGFRQLDQVFAPWGTIADGYAVARPVTPGGRLFAFATVIDNHYSGDPIFVPASRVAGSPAATPTPTRTPASGNPDLYLYKPASWPGCVVANYRDNCCPPSTEFLSSYLDTWFFFAIANNGPGRLTGPVSFGLLVDGIYQGTATWSNESGLDPGYYMALTWQYDGFIPVGHHNTTIQVDPNGLIAETNEGNNSCAFSGEWTAIEFGTDLQGRTRGNGRMSQTSAALPLTTRALAADATTLYLPATAHASGVNGASWRTDAEVHNAGTAAASFTVSLLRQNEQNPTPETRTFSIGPQQSLRYVDILSSVFGFTGAASLRFTSASTSLLVTSRTYNLIGENPWSLPVGSSFGQFVPGLAESEAIGFGEEGRLIQLTHRDAGSLTDFRTNIGLVNVTQQAIDVRVDVFHADGSLMGTVQGDETRLRPYEFRQLNAVIGTMTSWCADGYAIVRTTTPGGRLFAFATVIDNHFSGDPIFLPAVKMTASTPPPTPTPTSTATTPTPTPTPTPTGTPGTDVVTGPSGTSVALPPGARSGGTSIGLSTGDGSTLAKPGETLVSPVVRTTVTGTGEALGDGVFRVTFPITGAVPDPEKLLLKVAVNTGPVYPVAGVYDASARTFSADLMGLWNGWNLGVVTRPGLVVTALAPAPERSPLGWVTPTDWQTCTFRVFDDTKGTANEAPAAFVSGVATALGKACDHLRGAEFRSPKLWVDGRWNPKARAVHIVQGTGPNDPSTSFSKIGEDDAAFSFAAYTDAQMHSLGQLYFNLNEWNTVIQPLGWSYGNVSIHELLHAVQSGYDFRDVWWQDGSWRHASMSLMEGTATLVGNVYQTNPNGIYGGEVTVRSPEPPQKVSEELLWFCCVNAYARQDFFAYAARRWNGESLRDLRWLFQALSDHTDGQFGKSAREYATLYRRAMDAHYQSAFGLPLPEVYTEFVLDRAYRHTAPALLRPADGSLKKDSLDTSLFGAVSTWDPAGAAPLSLTGIYPLSGRAFRVTVPEAARTARKLTLNVAVSGADVSRQGVRLFVFREKDGVMEAGGETELTNVTAVTAPVDVTVGPETQRLTVLVVNGSIADAAASVTVSSASVMAVFPESGVIPWGIPGCPDVDWMLEAHYALAWPATYRIVWNFGDGTPEVTVQNGRTVTHRWAAVGTFEVTASLYALPGGSLLGQGRMPAWIAYFEGDFRMTEFRGSSSGTIIFTPLPARMALDPTNTYFEYSSFVFSSAGQETHSNLYLYPPGGPLERLMVGGSKPSLNPTDCLPAMTISGNTLTMRFSAAASPSNLAGQCVSTQVTQTGSQIVGTVSFWEHHYGDSGALQSQGQGNYTFKGTYKK